MGIYGIIIVKTNSRSRKVSVFGCQLIKNDEGVFWGCSYRGNGTGRIARFKCSQIREAYVYARNLAIARYWFFVGYRNGKIDSYSSISKSKDKLGYPFYSLEGNYVSYQKKT